MKNNITFNEKTLQRWETFNGKTILDYQFTDIHEYNSNKFRLLEQYDRELKEDRANYEVIIIK